MINLKDYRDKELSLYILANILIFLIVHKYIDIDTSNIFNTVEIFSQIFASTVLTVIAFSFILVIECLFTSGFKSNLLYLFGFFGFLSVPGNTIFTKIKNKNSDNRFSYQSLAEKYPDLYKNLPSEKKSRLRYENEKWYAIYNQHREVSMIHFSNRDWLLCRDIYISTIVIIILYLIVTVVKLIQFNWYYLVFVVILAIITNIGTNRKAVRFAYNVIAYDITK